jgi:Type II/IV secretion system protein
MILKINNPCESLPTISNLRATQRWLGCIMANIYGFGFVPLSLNVCSATFASLSFCNSPQKSSFRTSNPGTTTATSLFALMFPLSDVSTGSTKSVVFLAPIPLPSSSAEIRGAEARVLLDALNTGHRGSLTTIHANAAEDALRRLSHLAMRSSGNVHLHDIESECRRSIDVVVHIARDGGLRSVREVLRRVSNF